MKPQDAIENRCEACFGTGTKTEMKPMKFGQKIAAPPACPICKGTGLKLEAH
jgi:DnaJ-class molecular chaperone